MSQGHSPATPLLSSLKLTALVTSPCRDARSVRPLCPSVTASVTSPCRDARSVRPSCPSVTASVTSPCVWTHGLCVRCSTARRDIVMFLTGTDAQTERPYRESFCFVDNYSSRLCASLQRDTRIIVTRQVVTRCGVVSQLLLLLRRISSMRPICVPLVTMIENLPAPSFTITKQAFTS